ncbi:SDR family NAD(P)-dependent oxidoreductase [Actinomadura sp. LD22]|uniref:SDR family NAD(P)-dependent oxidoreductase n=1 Tax=Actinomadura physcomitrii TaxID=2650748 RepID=A0A6I4MGK6_9ACTN|nr:type I polyketide synthase [Actinomadura physcomitrii]MWA04030.1 SDR family NAD(P)-dependent oxidoreductase [Actinomadura physcomitrii]
MSSRIAIVGMACRFPDAADPGELWDNVLAGRRSFRRIPSQRIRLEDYYSADRDAADQIYITEAALLRDWEFDRVRFKVAGSTFRNADLTHWLALETAAAALADAGFPEGRGAPGETTGVLVGNSLTGEGIRAAQMRLRWPYVRRVVADALKNDVASDRLAALLAELEHSYKAPFPVPDGDSLAGGLSNTIAGRICNHFDFNGGGYVVDGACASSLLSVITACNALVSGDMDLAVAGGVDISVDATELIGFSRAGALAVEEMRVYDQRSAGFWPGEGCGMVVLMREEDAVARGHHVHGFIDGWGVSSDGAGGITRPETDGQRLALDRAYRRAGFGPDEVGYFEGHGTGTAVGDAAELETLIEARRAAGGRAAPAAVGSIKANIGHTKAAAGIAGLIKGVKAAGAGVLPPTTGCERPHPLLDEGGDVLRVLRKGEAWPEGVPLRAGVSAMGFGGINTHVVVEAPRPSRRARVDNRTRSALNSPQDAELFALDADTPAALAERATALAAVAEAAARSELPDLAAHLAGRLDRRPWRAAVVAGAPAKLADALRRVAELAEAGTARHIDPAGGVFVGGPGELPRIVFLFPGQGSGTRSDGGALRRRFDTVDELYEAAALPAGADQVETAVAQPRIATASAAGLRVLTELGVQAQAAVGHSLGEITALHWADALDEDALLRIAAARGATMSELAEDGGSMAGVSADAQTVAALLAEQDDGVVIAGHNGPKQTVVSGPSDGLLKVIGRATRAGLQAVRLPVSHAFHSPLVAPAADAFAGRLAEEPLDGPRRQVFSTVTGAPLAAGTAPDELRRLLREQITAPVLFTEALTAAADRADLLIEVGPGQVLTHLAREITGVPAVATRTDEDSLGGLLAALGAAFAAGAGVRVAGLFADRLIRPFDPDTEPVFIYNFCEDVPEVDAGLLADASARAAATGGAPAGEVPGEVDAGDPLMLMRTLVARRAEFPLEAVQADSKFLDDLHLSSIVVSELVGEAMRTLDLAETAAPTGYATATLGQVAETLQELVANGGAGGEDAEAAAAKIVPPGVGPWVRAFAVDRRETAAPGRAAPRVPGAWRVVGDHPAADAFREALEVAELGEGVLVIVPPGEERLAVLRAGADAVLAGKDVTRCVIVQDGPGAAGFAKTLHLEAPWVATTVVSADLADPAAPGRVAADAAATVRFREVIHDGGVRREPVLAPVAPHGADLPLGPDDVLLVTGGGKGISAECALALARESGAKLALVGRSDPAGDGELTANLERMAAAGVTARYLRADVTDAVRVAAVVEEAEAELGKVTAVLHGAGGNVPKLLEELTDDDYARTIDPKVAGLEAVLAAVDTARLRLVITFGSMTGRAGLRGEAHYAVANEWQSDLVERLAAELPHCRFRAVEWSLWSGVGMGERLGSVENLSRAGVTTITPDQGVAMLRALAADPDAPVVAVVTGRFGEMPTVSFGADEPPLLRFLERTRVNYPGIELVADSEVTWASDPYLAEHVFGGGTEAVLPGTVGMEIMAQAAAALLGLDIEAGAAPVMTDVEFLRAIAVAQDAAVTVRVAALRDEAGRVTTVVRCSTTNFQVDHFRAVCEAPAATPKGGGLVRPDDAALPPMAIDPQTELYGPMLFHGPRFRLMGDIRRADATHVTARLLPDTRVGWFGRYLPPTLLLGDPAARDAYMQPLALCAPTVLAIPAGVRRLVPGPRAGATAAFVHARYRTGEDCWDMEVTDEDGELIETWEGFTTRMVEKFPLPAGWVPALLGPYVEHALVAFGLAGRAAVDTDPEGASRREAAELIVRRLLGGDVALRHRPDGKPEASSGEPVSIAHCAGVTLATSTPGCDLERVTARDRDAWAGLLGADGLALAEALDEDFDTAATRVWAAGESAVKAGLPAGTPFTLHSTHEDGWAVLAAGDVRVATMATGVRGVAEPVVLAVLTGPSGEARA